MFRGKVDIIFTVKSRLFCGAECKRHGFSTRCCRLFRSEVRYVSVGRRARHPRAPGTHHTAALPPNPGGDPRVTATRLSKHSRPFISQAESCTPNTGLTKRGPRALSPVQRTFDLWVLHENQEPVSQSGAGGLCARKEQVSHSHSNIVQGEPGLRTVSFLQTLEPHRDPIRRALRVRERDLCLPPPQTHPPALLSAPQREEGRCA